jgi:hypothetical protein
MFDIGRSAALLAVAVLAACGSGSRPDFSVRGTAVFVNSTAPFTQRSDFPARVESTLDSALSYWGGSWKDLAGVTISFEGEEHVPCGDFTHSNGCYDGDIRVSTRDPAFTFYCVEETVLVHEVGHAVIGDPGHTDPRWLDFTPVQQALDGRPGYADTGEVPCQIFVSVWRHPPRR